MAASSCRAPRAAEGRLLVLLLAVLPLAGVALHRSDAASRPQGPQETMSAAVVVGANPDPCPPNTGDKGVHAAAEAVAASCDAHLERIQKMAVEKPKPGPGQMLVRVAYSSVNPCNWKSILSNSQSMISGIDLSGTVERVVSPCSFSVGDEVWASGGSTYAEYVVLNCNYAGLKPSNLGLQEAGALPTVALTGLMGFELAGAPWRSLPTVLVLAGSSGTGSVGIQLAKAMGAGRVISTCSEQNFDAVRGFGADQVIDYHKQNWWEVLARGSVDIIYDCACIQGTGNHAYDVLADGGHFITIQLGPSASQKVARRRPSVTQHVYLLSGEYTGKSHLDLLKGFAEAGHLRTPIDSTFELADVGPAFKKSMEGHTVGKISVHVR